MPEGNEVHRHAEWHGQLLAGSKLGVEGPNGRFADEALRLHGRKLKSVEAFGKHLFYDFGKDRQLHVHLGLYGKFRDGELPYPEMRGALRLRMTTDRHWLELRGPTACEILDDAARAKLLARIGPDPLRTDADVKKVIRRIHASRSPMAALLMDQSVLSGVGNIYRAELLYRAGIDPFLPGSRTTPQQIRSIWKDAMTLMRSGMEDRRIVTTKPIHRPHPKGKARRYETHYVYRRKGLPCFVCQTAVQMEEFAGRKLFWCPGCQAPAGEE